MRKSRDGLSRWLHTTEEEKGLEDIAPQKVLTKAQKEKEKENTHVHTYIHTETEPQWPVDQYQAI